MCVSVRARSLDLTIDLYTIKPPQGEEQLENDFSSLPYLFHTAVGSQKEQEKLREGA